MNAGEYIGPRGLTALLLVVVFALVAGPAVASAETPDPLDPGPLGFIYSEYDVGAVETGLGEDTTDVRVAGNIHYPASGVGPFPVLVFMHGNHSTCTSGPEGALGLIAGPSIFAEYDNAGCSTGSPFIDEALAIDVSRSYQGYDYLAEVLASNGYIVASMDINDITTWGENGNAPGYMGRVETMSRTFDLIAGWNDSSGPDGIGDALLGKVDMSSVGVMGHSRGGEGVNLFSVYNEERPKTAEEAAAAGIPDFGPSYPLDAVFSLAPVDGQGGFNPTVDNTAFATLLPYCDGDVFNLQGAPVFERSKQVLSDGGFPALQYMVNGANHNFFNSIWVNDDAQLFDFGDPACVTPGEANPGRLTSPEQKNVGLAIMGAFLRLYVGDETVFEPIVVGDEYPESACPPGEIPGVGVTCRNVVQTSYVAPAPDRRVLLAPADETLPAATPAGDAISYDGFAMIESCFPEDDPTGFFTMGCGSIPNRSPVWQLSFSWLGPASIGVDLAGEQRDLSGFGSIAFRGGVNYTSLAAIPEVEPVAEITLTDGSGNSATELSRDHSSALEPQEGTTARKEVLSGVEVPLELFADAGVDLSTVESIEIGFGNVTLSGAIELTDLVLQRSATPVEDPVDPTDPTDPADPYDPGDEVSLILNSIDRNKKRGVAFAEFTISHPGIVKLNGKGIKKKVRKYKRAGDKEIRIKTKGKKRKRLLKRGKVRVKGKIRYTTDIVKPIKQRFKARLIRTDVKSR